MPPAAHDRFVGRERQLRQVEATLDRLATGRGAVVVVSGEAGVGKTRFCAEVAERAGAANVRVVTARCWLDGGAPPLWPWQPILDDLDGPGAADLLASDAPVTEMGTDRFARFVAVTDRLAEVCARGPVCIVIDDIHGADVEALLLTRFVARWLPAAPLALVLSRRTADASEPSEARRSGESGEAADQTLDELADEGTAIALHRFDLAETAAFLASSGLGGLQPELVETLFRLAGGHPLFLRRIATLDDAPPGAGRAAAAAGGVRAAIDDALARLPEGTRRILSRAAVLGPSPVVTEAAEVAGCEPVAVLAAVELASAAGLVDRTDGAAGRFAFSHELVRATIEDRLDATDLLEAHARAAAVASGDDLAAPTAERLARAAHHARHAAARSAEDTRRAVTICTAAARAMVTHLAYERADTLLSAAVGLHDSPHLGLPPARLALEWAQAAERRGHMDDARSRFEVAITRADAEGEAALFAEAVLGRGGMWVDENRTAVERARMQGMYRRALEELPEGERACAVLRERLVTRLAAEEAFNGGPLPPLTAALAAASRRGDARALAEALSLTHHALFVPEHARARLHLADELVQVASETGQEVMALTGLLWRALDLIHLADVRATRALEVLRERASALGNQHILYNVGIIDVLRALNRGEVAAAEAQAWRVHELGEQIGRADRLTLLGGQLVIIRWLQGEDDELFDAADAIATSPHISDEELGVATTAAWLAARRGALERARLILDRALPDKLADAVQTRTWMGMMVSIVEVAAMLDDRDLAGQAYDLLLPFAELPAIVGLGVACLGSTERALGVAAGTLGEHDRAVEHLDRAVDANRQMENRPLATIALADLAYARRRRDDPAADDRDRSAALLDQAVSEATSMKLTGRVAAWEADLARWRQARPGGSRSVPEPRRGVIRRDGRRWLVAVDGRRARVGNLVGMAYLADLLTSPGRRIPATTLVGKGAEPERPLIQPILDDDARAAYAARARELSVDLADAESDNDVHRAERVRAELDALVDELESATGLGGRARTFPDQGERARTAARKAIKRAIDAVDDVEPALADLLRTTISTGATCTYHPDPARPVVWSAREA